MLGMDVESPWRLLSRKKTTNSKNLVDKMVIAEKQQSYPQPCSELSTGYSQVIHTFIHTPVVTALTLGFLNFLETLWHIYNTICLSGWQGQRARTGVYRLAYKSITGSYRLQCRHYTGQYRLFSGDFPLYRYIPNHSLPVRCGFFTTILYGLDSLPVDTAERHSSNTFHHSLPSATTPTLFYQGLDFLTYTPVHSSPTYDHSR